MDFELIPLSPEMPEGTDFCLIMDSELMEPLINKGETVCVCRSLAPDEMEVGIFFYKGKVYCRQYCEDYAGNLHLLCANPRREKENLCLSREEKAHCLCLGKVLLRGKPQPPMYI